MTRKAQTKVVPSAWLQRNALRLDCGPYLSGAIEAEERLRVLSTEPLSKVSSDILHAGRVSRQWVSDPEHGVPFLGSTEILQADLSTLSLISRQVVKQNPKLTIDEGWTLITRSGTVGRMAYSRSDMAGMACSEHVLRVVPDAERILPGYLYAFLSSRYGVPVVAGGTYGAIIQHIEPDHIADLPVPRLGEVENEVHQLVTEAADLRVQASTLLNRAITAVEVQLQADPGEDLAKRSAGCTTSTSSDLVDRMDGYYFAKESRHAREHFDRLGQRTSMTTIGRVAEVWIPTIFKRVYADDPEYGYPYLTGKEVYELMPSTELFLRRDVAEDNRLVIERGMILIQDSGQVSGLLGKPVIVGRQLDGYACTNNMVRIQIPDPIDAGYLFALLSTKSGQRLLRREAAGSSIPHLDAKRITELEIPWPDDGARHAVGELVVQAQGLRDHAVRLDKQATDDVEHAIEGASR